MKIPCNESDDVPRMIPGLSDRSVHKTGHEQEAPRRSEAELRALIENVPAMVFVATPGPSNAFVSRRWREYTGLSSDDTAGLGWQTVLHPDDMECHMEKWQVCSESGQPFEDEARFRRAADGEYRWFLVRAAALRNEAGNVLKWYGVLTEIEDRKRMEQALRRSEAYLAEGQRLSHTGSWAWNPATGEPLYWSEEMFRIFGLNLREGVPSPETFWQRIHPEDLDRTHEVITKAALGDMDYEHEHRIVLPDGTVKHIHAIGHPVLDASGRVAEYVGTAMDVTERKRAEEALRRSQGYLTEGQRLSHAGSWAWNPLTEQLFYWSEEMFRIFETDPEQGLPTSEVFWRRIHPEDRGSMRELVKKSAIERKDYAHDHRILLPDGTVKHIYAIGHPVFNESGEFVEFIGTAIDVTERKQAEEALRDSEERFRITFENAGMAMALVDMQGRSLKSNPALEKMLGYSDQELSRMVFTEFTFPDEGDLDWALYRELVSGKRDKYELDKRYVTKDGKVIWAHLIVTLIRDMNAAPKYALRMAEDVTERKRAEEERERLRQLEADLAHTNRVSMLGELAASLAHELNQPITGAITSTNACMRWLAHDPPDLVRARAAMMRVEKDGTRASEIINRLRAFYKKGAPPQRELIDIEDIVNEMVVLLGTEANRHSVAVVTKFAPRLHRVLADRVQLQQIFMNLMLNAIEAMKNTGGKLTIHVQHTRDHMLLTSIADSGIGLPPEKADQIFDAFFTTKPDGTGMGLTISRSIVEAHGGRLWATNNAERGATFHFTLPANAGAMNE